MRLPYHIVDAFADRLFAGNPAAVIRLDRFLPAGLMQSIAAENNLSETAFAVAEGQDWNLRWFTPTGDRVRMGGTGVPYARGEILLPG